MFKKLIEILKAHPRKIVFTEGTDPRILEASARLLSGTFLTPILIGNEQEILAAAEDAGFNIRGAVIIDPEKYEKFWAAFGSQIKYGVVADYGAHKDNLKDLLLFWSSKEGKNTTLAAYKDRMPEDQPYYYYACGESVDKIAKLPRWSGFWTRDMRFSTAPRMWTTLS